LSRLHAFLALLFVGDVLAEWFFLVFQHLSGLRVFHMLVVVVVFAVNNLLYLTYPSGLAEDFVEFLPL
jgi:hypothetical protein